MIDLEKNEEDKVSFPFWLLVPLVIGLLLVWFLFKAEPACASTYNMGDDYIDECEVRAFDGVDNDVLVSDVIYSVRTEELSENSYRELAKLVRAEPFLKPVVRKAFADGKVTVGEYQDDIRGALYDREQALRDQKRDRVRDELRDAVGAAPVKPTKDAIPL